MVADFKLNHNGIDKRLVIDARDSKPSIKSRLGNRVSDDEDIFEDLYNDVCSNVASFSENITLYKGDSEVNNENTVLSLSFEEQGKVIIIVLLIGLI